MTYIIILKMLENRYIIFDGDCGFCNKSIMILAKIDANNKYLFISNLSEKGKNLIHKFKLKNETNGTIILIIGDEYFLKSKAIFNFITDAKNSKILKYIFSIFPVYFCDKIYDFIAKNRKKIKTKLICKLPNKNISQKIINQ